MPVVALEPAVKFTVPENTHSPSGTYGVTVPQRGAEDAEPKGEPKNELVETGTGRVLAVLEGETGWDRMNHGGVLPARWAGDASLLVWSVDGKWGPRTLVLVKLEKREVAWQRDVLKLAQEAILQRTRTTAPARFAEAKKANAGSGSAYPEGFTINVEAPGAVKLPLQVRATLTSNPKGIDGFPTLESELSGVLDAEGKFKLTGFKLSPAPQ